MSIWRTSARAVPANHAVGQWHSCLAGESAMARDGGQFPGRKLADEFEALASTNIPPRLAAWMITSFS